MLSQHNTKDTQLRMLQLMEATGLSPCVRLRSTNTSADVGRLILVSESLPIERLVLAARSDVGNRAVLVALFNTSSLTLIMDSTWLNIAREPRQREVMELTRKLNELGLLARCEYAQELVEDTSQMTPEEAAKILFAKTLKPLKGNLAPYLQVLGQVSSLATLGITEEEFLHQPLPTQQVARVHESTGRRDPPGRLR